MICVLQHSDNFTGDELTAVATLDTEQLLVVVGAVEATVVHVESFSRQMLATFCNKIMTTDKSKWESSSYIYQFTQNRPVSHVKLQTRQQSCHTLAMLKRTRISTSYRLSQSRLCDIAVGQVWPLVTFLQTVRLVVRKAGVNKSIGLYSTHLESYPEFLKEVPFRGHRGCGDSLKNFLSFLNFLPDLDKPECVEQRFVRISVGIGVKELGGQMSKFLKFCCAGIII